MAVFGSRSSFRDVRAWYSRLAVLDRQVCRIERLDGQPVGTGFLVGPDVVMTATHVPNYGQETPGPFFARFDYVLSPVTGKVLEGTKVELQKPNYLLGYSPTTKRPGLSASDACDTLLAQLAEPIGLGKQEGRPDVRGWVDLNEAVEEVPEGSGIAIMQHVEGGPLKLSVNTQAVLGVDANTGRLLYRTDTAPGASGAPCFDIDWRFVAMHEGRDVGGGNHNLGIPFTLIKSWLQRENLWHYVAQRSPVTASLMAVETTIASPAQTQFAMPPDLRALVEKGESQLIEFKRGIATGRARRGGKGDITIEMNKVLTSVAAFMNSSDGGTIMIGIEDDRSIVGIMHEYSIIDPHSPSWDGYDRYLVNKLTDRLQVWAFHFFSVARYHEQDKDICAIHVQPADRPVFFDNELYVRVGAQNRPIKGQAVLDYVNRRFAMQGTP